MPLPRFRRAAIFGTLVLGTLSVTSASAAEITLSATADTFIGSGALEANNGGANSFLTAGVDLQGNKHRALYAFNLAAIPSNAVVSSATFATVTQNASKGPFPATFGLFAVQADWGEGAGSGAGKGSPAQPGEATWASRKLGVVAWSAAGGDFDPTALATTSMDSFGVTFEWSSEALAATVQSWITNAANNHGLLLKDQAESGASVFQLGSREGGKAAKLTITYTVTVATPPPQIKTLSLSTNGQPRMLWLNNPGKQYDVEFATGLSSATVWSVAESNITATVSGTNEWFDPRFLPPGPTARFYRVRERP